MTKLMTNYQFFYRLVVQVTISSINQYEQKLIAKMIRNQHKQSRSQNNAVFGKHITSFICAVDVCMYILFYNELS